MIYTMWNCMGWRKLLLSHVDLLQIIKAVIIEAAQMSKVSMK
jgi:hypothetical protein